jgi:hypothetical protein
MTAQEDINAWAEEAFHKWMNDCSWRYKLVGVKPNEAMAYLGLICMLGFVSTAVAYGSDEERLIEIVRKAFRNASKTVTEIKQELGK